jgi:hypothetical protein
MHDLSNSEEPAVYTLDGEWLVPTNLAQGPWNPEHQSGGAVAGILARAVEAAESPIPMRIARLSFDLMRPFPMRPLKPRIRLVRGGRRIQVLDAWLEDGDVPVARVSALRVRRDSSLNPGGEFVASGRPPPRPELDRKDHCQQQRISYLPGWMRAVDYLREEVSVPGQTNRAWVRLRHPLVACEITRPSARLAALGDFSSGIANALDFSEWTSPNADLSLHILREPETEWLFLEGSAAISDDGLGQSNAIISDEVGVCAWGQASLLVDRLPPG